MLGKKKLLLVFLHHIVGQGFETVRRAITDEEVSEEDSEEVEDEEKSEEDAEE